MKRRLAFAALAGLVAACASPDNMPTAPVNPASQLSSVNLTSELAGPADAKIMHARGFAISAEHAAGKPARRSPNMTYHGGVIMTTSDIHPIFWGTSWASYSGDKIIGIDSLYAGWNNSHFAGTNTEYAGSNGTVGKTSTSAASVIDATAATGGNNTGPILSEVCKEISAGKVPLVTSGNGYYPVYTDIPRGSAGFCAWHSAGTCNGKRVQFAFFWKLDSDSGCDPGAAGGHSQGLSALANVTAHELSEAVTDPASPGAWYDPQGAENADKCAWVFNASSLTTLSNGAKFKVQGNWSNAAYNAGTGYANSSGQRGCIN